MWRYRESIPIIHDENIVSFNEGYTPMVRAEVGGAEVLLKLEYVFPSGSYKDRGATVMMSKIKELGVTRVVEDSSGNAGSAVAAYCARAGIECSIYVPGYASQGKLTQIEMYGATLNRVQGTREDTAAAAYEAAEETYYASHLWSPFFVQGTKTFVYEVVEQLGWEPPDNVVMPLGHGGMLLGIYIGLTELKDNGLIDRFPRLIGIQSESCDPIAEAYRRGLDDFAEIDKKETIAEGVAVAEPLRAPQILEAVRETGGEVLSVSERQVREALKATARRGFYIEPTSATAVAGLGSLDLDGVTVVPLTGHGLKATDKLMELF